MAIKPYQHYAMPDNSKVDKQSGESENNYDRSSSENPNAQGPKMRAPYDACAGVPNYPADAHDTYEAPYPRIQRGAVATGIGSASERKDGPGGRW